MSSLETSKPSRLDPPRVTRRSFLSFAAIGSFLSAAATAVAGMLRLPKPAVLPGPVRRFKIGHPEQFSVGTETLFEKENFYMFRDTQGVYAVSATCTHLGCTVRAEALPKVVTETVEGQPVKLTHRFACPCHGSMYRGDGANVSGPAPKPLAWYQLSVAPDDGQLVVDLAQEVEHDFRLTV